MEVNKKKAGGVVFLSTIFVMFALEISGVLIDVEKYNKGHEPEPAWSAVELYQFSEEQKQETSERVSFGKQFSNMIAKFEEKIEREVTDYFYFRMPFVLAKKVSDKAVGLDMTKSQTGGEPFYDRAVIPYSEDSLGYVFSDSDISEKIDSLITFGKK